MKKIYLFYLYDYEDNMNTKIYPAIDETELVHNGSFYHTLYAWTPNKSLRKQFKTQRDMNKFKEVIHEIEKDDFDKFSDIHSDTFLEERSVTTKDIIDHIITRINIHILSTRRELDNLVDNQLQIMKQQLESLIKPDIYLREMYFSEVYQNVLRKFKFDDIMEYLFPLEDDGGLPFNPVCEDTLAIYTHLYYNTYRKDINL